MPEPAFAGPDPESPLTHGYRPVATPLPFNSLGQILSAGAEIPIARQASAGVGGALLVALIGRRFPRLSPNLRPDVGRIAEAAVSGGVNLLQGITEPDQVIPLDRLPVQSLLPPEIIAGGDAIIEASIGAEGVRQIRAMLRLNHGDTLGDLIDAALDEVIRRIGDSPDKFDEEASAVGMLDSIQVFWGERLV